MPQPSSHALVLRYADGEPSDTVSLNGRHYNRVPAVTNLRGFRHYDLRHTCAILLLLAGVHLKDVSKRLGHSSIRQTLDTYSHVSPSMQQQASIALEEVQFDLSHEAPNRPQTAVD